MPAPNDLTPEDEAAFAEHGVAPLGQGREPVDDGQPQPQQADDQPEPQHGDRHPGQQQQDDGAAEEISNRHPDGKFKSKEEMDAEREALAQQEPKMVPLAALHQERQRIAEISRRAQLAETRMNAMIASGFGQQRQQPGQPQKPDLVESPAEYILNIERRLEQFEQANQQDQEARQLDTALTNDEDLYKTTVTDYDQASHYFVQSRARELLQFYPPDEAQRMMTEEARNIAKLAWARGQSAGEAIYNLAQARGYVRGQTQPQGQQQQGQQQNGPSATDTVRSIRQGQAASRSLSGGRGSGGTQALNAQALLEMNDDEFEEYLGIGKKGANERFSAIG